MIVNAIKTVLGFNLISLTKFNFFRACQNAFTSAHITDTRLLTKIPVEPLERVDSGTLPQNQLLVLLHLLRKYNPKVVVEIGTFKGHTTKAMAEALPKSTIHTIDLPEEYSKIGKSADDLVLVENRMIDKEFSLPNIVRHLGDTAGFDFSVIKGATFFFIDGSHTYEYVLNDTKKCFEMCFGKGFFLWHDCDFAHSGVVKALSELRANGHNIVRIEGTPLAYLNNL